MQGEAQFATYFMRRCFTGEEQEWTYDIANAICDEHHRTDSGLLGKLCNVRRHH